jgi:predicted ATP-dependent endonuclease of OLD family
MKIARITIENFRSIKEPVSFEMKKIGLRHCYILLGINETGKSNILCAISLLNKEANINYGVDCNKEAEEVGEDILITYDLEIENLDFYKNKIKESGLLDADLVKSINFEKIERKVSIDKDNARNDFVHIYLKDNKKLVGYVVKGEKIEIKIDSNTEKDEVGNETNVLTKEKLEEYLEDNFFDLFDDDIPEVIFWKSDPKYLINQRIDLNQFKEDNNLSIPLRNCFQIADIEDIKGRIEKIINSPAKRVQLEQKLSESVTKHINDVWPEHKVGVKFSIDNMQLSFLVEDNDNNLPKYEVAQRSDGFKHFISILLNLSVEAKRIKNKIVLIDEPEIHLHPSGQKYLRDELLRIAKDNIVFFATHSIYMVDKKNLDRHFSIKKGEGKTINVQIDKDDPYKEEVLYEALGTSVLEHVEPNVLIFEGKTDRDIFELYARKFKKEISCPKVSLISADSANSVIKYTKFFNTKLIKGYVIFDSDKEGIGEKNKVLKEQNYTKQNTFEINEILDTNKNATIEDLFDKKYLETAIKEQYDLDLNLEKSKPYIEQVKTKLQENKKPYRDAEKEEIRRLFFRNISRLKIEDLKKQQYFKFYQELCKKIQQ